MPADLDEKTDRYERLLADALDAASVAPPDGTPLAASAAEYREMARSYLDDGRHFREQPEPCASVEPRVAVGERRERVHRIVLFAVSTEDDLFAV